MCLFDMSVSCLHSSTILASSCRHGDVLSEEDCLDLKLVTSINCEIILHQMLCTLHVLIIITYINRGGIEMDFTNIFHNSNSIGISFSCKLIAGDHIAIKLCICHDSTAVVSCAKFCSDHYTRIWMRAKLIFHHISIVMEKMLEPWLATPPRSGGAYST